MKKLPLLAFVALPFLGACANAPRTVTLDPEISTQRVQGQPWVQLTVVGSPLQAPLGEGESRFALTTPAVDAIQEKLKQALASAGYGLAGSGQGAKQLKVDVVKCDHWVKKGVLRDTIELSLLLQWTVTSERGSFSRNFEDQRTQQVAGRANSGEVAGLLNQALGQMLSNALRDPGLVQALVQ